MIPACWRCWTVRHVVWLCSVTRTSHIFGSEGICDDFIAIAKRHLNITKRPISRTAQLPGHAPLAVKTQEYVSQEPLEPSSALCQALGLACGCPVGWNVGLTAKRPLR